jgi:hypothetical protein
MKLLVRIITFIFVPGTLFAQKATTIVPAKPVPLGSAFQVQFVVTDPPEKDLVPPASFDSFRIVSGPNIYEGRTMVNGQSKKIRNIAFTLVPLSLGKQKIKGIVIQGADGMIKSNDVNVTVIPQPKASFQVQSSYTDASLYAPSSKKDLEQLVDENHFVKAEVSTQSCYQGQPVVATFKLYSRLQSSSEVTKSPALYGFTAMDMLDINRQHQSVESIHDKIYNVSILRKVQLYPVSSGKQMIDAIHVRSQIEFRDSNNPERKLVIDRDIASSPVSIEVRSLPAGSPQNFSGTVGQFMLQTVLEKDRLSVNEEAKLLVTISGSGDFLQMQRPGLHWPSSIDVFDQPIRESISKEAVPLSGERTYAYSFTVTDTGRFVLPPVQFAFFDPVNKKYQNIQSDSIRFTVSGDSGIPLTSIPKPSGPGNFSWIIITMLVGTAALLLFFWKRRSSISSVQKMNTSNASSYEAMQNLQVHLLTEKQTCIEVRSILSQYLRSRYHTSDLQQLEGKMPSTDLTELKSLFHDCEVIGYSSFEGQDQKELIRERALSLLSRWEQVR